jgi:hypothetical protein
MKLRTATTGLGILALAGAALAWQISNQESPVAKHLVGKWTIHPDITRRLEPDSRLAQFTEMSFTDDASVMKRMSDIAVRMRGLDVTLSGMMTLDGNANPYVLTEHKGTATLIWFHPGDESKVGDPVWRLATIVLAREPMNDLLFLGAEDGARNASVCFRRTGSGR